MAGLLRATQSGVARDSCGSAGPHRTRGIRIEAHVLTNPRPAATIRTMPRRNDLQKVLIIGSGPIVIGQACEFDYSGAQACKALREEGIEVVLVNSNPATIMTDPQMADRTYIEPITPEVVDRILRLEADRGSRVNALLPTLGGQTALNCACACYDKGILARHGVQMIGASREAIQKAEGRTEFKQAMIRIGLDVPRSVVVRTWEQARAAVLGEGIADHTGHRVSIPLPVVIRPAFTLGGTGGGFAFTEAEFVQIARRGLAASPISEILVEESCLGWKEFELEVMRDRADNVCIICGIENLDPMGVHTGDSITVAPIQTLTDKEYQRMRNAAIRIIREIGVDTGGSNIQFAVHPQTGRMIVIEMNPRVSRSSALASKATGYPIARIAAKLAIGYTLDELPNEITRSTRASFEPVIDYVVTKIPRFAFEKFPEADETLTTQMKSVGEVMAIGRTFKESLQKAIRGLEIKRSGLGLDANDAWLSAQRQDAATRATVAGAAPALGGSTQLEAPADTQESAAASWPIPEDVLRRKLEVPSQGRLYYVRYAMKLGWSDERIHEVCRIDPWFLGQLRELCAFEQEILAAEPAAEPAAAGSNQTGNPSLLGLLTRAKQLGYSDAQLAFAWKLAPAQVAALRRGSAGLEPVYKLVDTCASEFVAVTPYYYSSHESASVPPASASQAQGHGWRDDEIRVSEKPKVVILGGGPNRIGQGIEFDYCCVHAAYAARELGFEAVIVNSNPETVSTDFDTSDLLFFEPLTHEDVLHIVRRLDGTTPDGAAAGRVHGVICQFGGQTPLNLARPLHDSGVKLLGTSVESIELAEDRQKFQALLAELGLRQPPNGTARTLSEAREVADRIGYPVLIRPGFVLGGRGMEICNDPVQLGQFMQEAIEASEKSIDENPVLIDKFLDVAIEVDVDAVADGTGEVIICGILEHIEAAGVHSGDAAMSLPPYSLSLLTIEDIREATVKLARRLGVCGLMNVQFAVRDQVLYVLEVNPRASRTVPFVAKATSQPWARIAAKCMLGMSLAQQGIRQPPPLSDRVAIKESVFPFAKFPGVDVILGPEMRSTGEVMGMDATFALAFAKSQMAANQPLPLSGTAYLSVKDSDKPGIIRIAQRLRDLGFQIVASVGTADALARAGVKATVLPKIQDNTSPNILDLIRDGQVQLIVNTPTRRGRATDEGRMRAAAVMSNITMMTTIPAATAAARAIEALQRGDWGVRALQDHAPTV